MVPEAPSREGGDGPTALFVRRPVLAIVLNLLIVVAGVAAILGAEVRELPSVDSPVISVTTGYAGAGPETIDREITAEVESAAGRVPGIASISSSSSFGRSRVTAEFSSSTDLDVAASDMRDAVGRIARELPDAADDPVIVKADADAEAVMRLAVTSDERSAEALTLLVEDDVLDRLTAIEGIADLQVYGDREQVFRIDVDPARLAARGLSVADLAAALDSVAFDTPAGSLANPTTDLAVRATATVADAAGFEALRIDGVTRVGDVATVTLGADVGTSSLRANGRTGVGIGVVRQAGSSTLGISRAVREAVVELSRTLPEDVDVRVTSDDATFISGSIREVLKSLGLAIGIVVTVIFVFLLDWRATLVPAITLPVALVGTVAGIWAAGFSINILTLLALVLATGLVVDDAIVVLENIVRKRGEGLGARAAAVLGTREVVFAVLATTATLAAVFVPLSFLPGKAGGLFREFGFTLAIAVLLSSAVSLSLCPMLASRVLGDETGGARRRRRGPALVAVAALGERLAAVYARAIDACLEFPLAVLGAAAGFAALAWALFGALDEELLPREDRAVVLMSVSAPEGVSLEWMAARMREVEALAEPFVEAGEVTNVFSITGRGDRANSGFAVLTLAPWEDRARSQDEIVGEMNRALARVPGVRAFVIQPNSLGIRGAGSGLSVALVGSDYGSLAEAANGVRDALEAEPGFSRVRIGYETSRPQLSIEIDRERAADLGIPIAGLAPAMQAVLDGREIGEVFIDDRAVPVKLVSTTHPVDDPTDLANLFLRAEGGRFVPMSSIATLAESAVAPELERERRRRAVTLSASLDEGLALRAALERTEAIAAPLLPDGARLVPLAEAATLNETSAGLALTFGFAIVIVFLVLAAQFESFTSSLIILVTVPFGLASAVFALHLTGTSLNVYSQIGLVLLVGIMAKNGILIVEFANQLRDAGADVATAAREAALQRLRPVTMTAVSTVLGGLPLVLASGPGAEARVALGRVIVGGLGIASAFTLLLTPVAYRLLAGLSKPRAAETRRLETELAAARAKPG